MVSCRLRSFAGSSYHPMYLFLVNMAAIGTVLLRVLPISPKLPSFGAGCW